MKSTVYTYFFVVIAMLYMCACKKEVAFKKEICPTTQEKTNWVRKHNELSNIIIEGTCLKRVTITEAILWLSDKSKCTISLALRNHNQATSEEDPFAQNKKQECDVFSVRIKNCNFLEALDVICVESGYYWKLSDDLIIVAPESHFVSHSFCSKKSLTNKTDK